MTITTVLHSPYTPGRPRAARPGPVSQSRPRLAIPTPARRGPARRENKTREPGPGMSCSALDCDPGPVSQSRSRAEWIARLGPAGRAVTGLPGSPGPVRADIPDNNVMVSSHSRHLAIMSSLARTQPKPSAQHITSLLTHSEL